MTKSTSLHPAFNPLLVQVCIGYECKSWGIPEESEVKVWAQVTELGPWVPVLEDALNNPRHIFCPRCKTQKSTIQILANDIRMKK